ncbi:hypothetical protein DE146DRAFT_106127 [Phaeosphaeria sp. MPI-PUGE-AT-0046c]|nr:hypothetical protein DE146DRAFT_106127 [Phaeosphaeria sp. MPI-PUGE-AT-0046c]
MDQKLHEYIRETFPADGLRLMGQLPRHFSLTWKKDPGNDPSEALVIGSMKTDEGDQEVIARIIFRGDRKIVQYLFKPKHRPDSSSTAGWRITTHENLMSNQNRAVSTTLVSPFKYLKGTGVAEEGKFSTLVRWYYMEKGLVVHQGNSSLRSFYGKLMTALKIVAQEKYEELAELHWPQLGTQSIHAPSTEALNQDNVAGEHENEGNEEPSRAPGPIEELQQLASQSDEDSADTEEKDYFRDRAIALNLHLVLERLPNPDQMRFSTQTCHERYLEKRLYIGEAYTEGKHVYAYLSARVVQFEVDIKLHDVEFRVCNSTHSSTSSSCRVHAEDLGGLKCTLVAPFDMIHTEKQQQLSPEEVVRLKTLVTWYFIVNCHTKGIVDGGEDTELRREDYTQHLVETLQFIGLRLGIDLPTPGQPLLDHETSTSSTNTSTTNGAQGRRSPAVVISSRPTPPMPHTTQKPTDIGTSSSVSQGTPSSPSSRLLQNGSAPIQDISNFKSSSSTPRGTKRTAADDIEEQLSNAWKDHGKLKYDHNDLLNKFHDLDEADKKRLNEVTDKKEKVLEEYLIRKDRLLKELQDWKDKADAEVDTADKELADEWKLQQSDLQRREREIKRQKNNVIKKIRLLSQSLPLEEEETDAETSGE